MENDDTGGLQSQVVFTSEIEATYLIYVTGFSSQAGEYILNVSCAAAVDCPELGLNIGDACDDGNELTIEDSVNELCICEGTPEEVILGCTNEDACNYDVTATVDDGSCDLGLWYIPLTLGEVPVVQACSTPEGYELADQPCIIALIAADPFCVNNSFDNLCFEAYVECLGVAECEAIESSMWGEGPWVSNGTQFTFIAANANDAILAQGDGDVSIEIFEGECGGTSVGVFNNYGAGSIERAVPGNLIAGNTYSYFVTGATEASVQSKVKRYAVTTIEAEYCNSTMELIDQIYCSREEDMYSNPAVNVVGFSFKFVNQVSGDEIILVDETVDGFYQQLTTVAGFELGATYDVSARHKVIQNANGSVMSLWSDYGPSCPITIESDVPLTNVRDQYCDGANSYSLGDLIMAYGVTGADMYEWSFDDGANVITHQTVGYPLYLYQVAGLQYGFAYNVSVRAHLNGVWGSFGSTCTIIMDSQPAATKVRDTHCGLDYTYPSYDLLLADYVGAATEYTWEFDNGVETIEFVTGNYQLLMYQAGLATGEYDVRVKAFAGGVYGDYGASCSITLNGGGDTADLGFADKSIVSSVEAQLFPNPNTGEFVNISLNNLSKVNHEAIIVVMDMFGKNVHSEQVSTSGTVFNYQVNFDQNLPAGMYLVQVQIDGERIIKKLIIE